MNNSLYKNNNMNNIKTKCNICGGTFKSSAFTAVSAVCSKCSDTEPDNNYLYDEETEFEISMVRNVGGRVPAVFDMGDSFGF